MKRNPASRHAAGGFVALVATEDEVDRRQHATRVEQLDRLDPPRRVERAPATAPQTALVRPAATEADRRRVEPRRVGVRTMLDERGQQMEAIVGAVADEIEVVELHRSPLLDHGIRRTTDGADPLGQLPRVAHGRRQADQLHTSRQVDDHLLPHRPAIGVLQEVHLVEHHDAQVVESLRSAVDHVAQHLGGHHDHWRVAVDRVVARSATPLSDSP